MKVVYFNNDEKERVKMSKEKYTIELLEIDDDTLCFNLMCGDKFITDFDDKIIAELVCRLLNENEDKPKIDKEMKEIIIECVNSKFRRYIHNDKTYEDYRHAIKILEKLPTEEN